MSLMFVKPTEFNPSWMFLIVPCAVSKAVLICPN